MRRLSASSDGREGEEVRRPKPEGRKKSEYRSPNERSKPGLISDLGFRASDFFRPSAFGLRTSVRDSIGRERLFGLNEQVLHTGVQDAGKGFWMESDPENEYKQWN
jgi:hypothetical protein